MDHHMSSLKGIGQANRREREFHLKPSRYSLSHSMTTRVKNDMADMAAALLHCASKSTRPGLYCQREAQ